MSPARVVAPLVLLALACGSSDDGDSGSGGSANAGSGGTGAGGSQGSGGASGTGGSDGASGTGGGTGGSAGTMGSGGAGGAGPTSGCGVAWTPADVEHETRRNRPPMQVARRTIDVGGVQREYLLAVPEGYDIEKPYALVFGLHGSGGSREQLRGYMDVESPANGEAIFLYPSGLVTDRGDTGWNLSSTSPDLAFIDALLEKYSGELCIDAKRVFATGHSFGGCMSNSLGCFRGLPFRAIAPVAGCSGSGRNATCSGRIATLLIHSPLDTSTGYGGAIGACTRYLRANSCDESPACGCHWVDELEDPADECVQEAQEPYPTQVSIVPDARDDQPPVLRQYLNCDPGYPVVFIDHWRRERAEPGSPDERWHNPPPWSGGVIWEFFSTLPVLDIE